MASASDVAACCPRADTRCAWTPSAACNLQCRLSQLPRVGGCTAVGVGSSRAFAGSEYMPTYTSGPPLSSYRSNTVESLGSYSFS